MESFTSSKDLVWAGSFSSTLMMWKPYCVLTRSETWPFSRLKAVFLELRHGLTLDDEA